MLDHAKDELATARRNFHSKLSYVSNAKHDYLAGLDKTMRRVEIYIRAGGKLRTFLWPDGSIEFFDDESAYCQGCENPHAVPWHAGQWHHKTSGLTKLRCDCLHCGLWVCRKFHEKQHVRVKSGKAEK
jgi:hypothetical protein